MPENSSISNILSKYLPEETVGICSSWVVQLNIHLRITKERATKFGDYRPLPQQQGHVITINHNLNKYSFLITFIHEVAHLITVTKFRSRFRSVSPHGNEWKNEYTKLLKYFLTKNIFPPDVTAALNHYAHSPAASSCTDANLMRVLKKYDTNSNSDIVHLDQLPEGHLFQYRIRSSQTVFKKGKRARSRFNCLEVHSGRQFMFSGIAEVMKMEQPQFNL